MSWIVKQIAGAFGGWILAGAVALLLGAGAAGGYAARGVVDRIQLSDAGAAVAKAEAARESCHATAETARADANADVARNFAQSLNLAFQLTDELAELQKHRDADTQNFLKRLRDVPQTKACASSPAFRLLLDRMRNDTAGAAQGTGN